MECDAMPHRSRGREREKKKSQSEQGSAASSHSNTAACPSAHQAQKPEEKKILTAQQPKISLKKNLKIQKRVSKVAGRSMQTATVLARASPVGIPYGTQTLQLLCTQSPTFTRSCSSLNMILAFGSLCRAIHPFISAIDADTVSPAQHITEQGTALS